jgi:hypothetical protein
MKIGEEEVTNLISTFTPSAKQLFQKLLRAALSDLPITPVQEGEALSLQAKVRVGQVDGIKVLMLSVHE